MATNTNIFPTFWLCLSAARRAHACYTLAATALGASPTKHDEREHCELSKDDSPYQPLSERRFRVIISNMALNRNVRPKKKKERRKKKTTEKVEIECARIKWRDQHQYTTTVTSFAHSRMRSGPSCCAYNIGRMNTKTESRNRIHSTSCASTDIYVPSISGCCGAVAHHILPYSRALYCHPCNAQIALWEPHHML